MSKNIPDKELSNAVHRDAALELLNTAEDDHDEHYRLLCKLAMHWFHGGGSEQGFYDAVDTSVLGDSFHRPNRLGYFASRAWAAAEDAWEPLAPDNATADTVLDKLKAVYEAVQGSGMRPRLKATAIALVGTGIQRGGIYTVRVSERELAELSGNAQKTVHRHLLELQGKDPNPNRKKKKFKKPVIPLVSQVSSPEVAGHCTEVVINLDYGEGVEVVNRYSPNYYTPIQGLGESCFPTFKDDVLEYFGTTTGKALEVYQRLSSVPETVSGVGSAWPGAVLDRGTVKKHLVDFVQAGLAETVTKGKRTLYKLAETQDWFQAYEYYGVKYKMAQRAETLEKRKQQFEKDRGDYARVVAARTAAREEHGGIVFELGNVWQEIPDDASGDLWEEVPDVG